MLIMSCSRDEQGAKSSHGYQDQADFCGYDLEVDLPQDVKLALPFKTACTSHCEYDHEDCEAQRTCQRELLDGFDFHFPNQL